MIPLDLSGSVRSILCIGAHPDDIEIGCGATLYTLRQSNPDAEFIYVVLTGGDARAAEARSAAQRLVGTATVHVLGLRDGYLPYAGSEPKDALRAVTAGLAPDVVFTHREDDRHQDHGLVSALTWQLFRSHLILEYEVPKYDGDLGRCNAYFPLSEAAADAKIDTVLDVFESQRSKYWMDADVLRSVLRLRGVEARSPQLLAEGFVARKLTLK